MRVGDGARLRLRLRARVGARGSEVRLLEVLHALGLDLVRVRVRVRARLRVRARVRVRVRARVRVRDRVRGLGLHPVVQQRLRLGVDLRRYRRDTGEIQARYRGDIGEGLRLGVDLRRLEGVRPHLVRLHALGQG